MAAGQTVAVLHSFFDSKYLIPGLRVSAAVSYFGNNTYSFYGFNGASSLYVPELDRITDDGLGFFIMKRDIFRIMTCLQGNIGDSKWGWAGGITYWNMTTGHARNKGLTDGSTSLYDLYVDNGVLHLLRQNRSPLSWQLLRRTIFHSAVQPTLCGRRRSRFAEAAAPFSGRIQTKVKSE